MYLKQRGNILVVAIFVIVVMGFLATSLVRVNWSNSDSQAREVLGTQAWLLTQSANEWVLTQMYPLNASAAVSSACSATINGASRSFSTQTTCEPVVMTCSNIGTLDEQDFFKVTATAICGSGELQVQRRQEILVKE